MHIHIRKLQTLYPRLPGSPSPYPRNYLVLRQYREDILGQWLS